MLLALSHFLFPSVGGPPRQPLTRIEAYSLARQQFDLNMTKRDRWTEDDVVRLPSEEPDIFERKGGKLFDDGQDGFLNSFAKALSAFANSGGGSIIIGATDDGFLDGLPPSVGRATIRDWIEMKIPTLVDYPLSDFRVHTVEKNHNTSIARGRDVIVVDVGDSAAAPHQSKRDKIYYRREGGRSVPAPHFYLELLRQRLTSPKIEISLDDMKFYNAYESDAESGLFVIIDLKFCLTNIGRVVANNWQINIKHVSWDDKLGPSRYDDILFSNFPKPLIPRSVTAGINVGSRAILPGCNYPELIKIGFKLRPKLKNQDELAAELAALILPISVGCQVATETSPGEIVELALGPAYNADAINAAIIKSCPDFFTGLPL